MNWDSGQSDFTEHDKSNFNFYYERECVVIRTVCSEDEVKCFIAIHTYIPKQGSFYSNFSNSLPMCKW